MLAYSRWSKWLLTGGAAGRLLLAAALGCAIGIDREYHHRPSGVRTNVLICFGAAMFTFLSRHHRRARAAPIAGKSRRISCRASAFSAPA